MSLEIETLSGGNTGPRMMAETSREGAVNEVKQGPAADVRRQAEHSMKQVVDVAMAEIVAAAKHAAVLSNVLLYCEDTDSVLDTQISPLDHAPRICFTENNLLIWRRGILMPLTEKLRAQGFRVMDFIAFDAWHLLITWDDALQLK